MLAYKLCVLWFLIILNCFKLTWTSIIGQFVHTIGGERMGNIVILASC